MAAETTRPAGQGCQNNQGECGHQLFHDKTRYSIKEGFQPTPHRVAGVISFLRRRTFAEAKAWSRQQNDMGTGLFSRDRSHAFTSQLSDQAWRD
jgi:hypothetical protein